MEPHRVITIISLNSLLFCFALACVVLFASCEQSQSSNSKEIIESLTQKVSELGDAITEKKQPIEAMASDEIEKLFVFEYKVQEVAADGSAAEIEDALRLLGLERWECFHIEEKEDILRLFCKRRPKTYLRYIPRVF